jgi:F420H(2)-dependent quinone reductase
MLHSFVVSPRGLALDRFLARYLGVSLTVQVWARAAGYEPGPVLYLETVGKKTGAVRGVALPYFVIDGKILIVGSAGGGPEDPIWAKNLRVTPEVTAYIKRKKRLFRARVSEGSERQRYWDALLAFNVHYREYEKLTPRQIPVIVLEDR